MRGSRPGNRDERKAAEKKDWAAYYRSKSIWNKIQDEMKAQNTSVWKVVTDLGMNASAVYATIRELNVGPEWQSEKMIDDMLDRKYASDEEEASGKYPEPPIVKDTDLYLIVGVCQMLNMDINDTFGTPVAPAPRRGNMMQDDFIDTLQATTGGNMKSMILAIIPYLTEEEQAALKVDMDSRHL